MILCGETKTPRSSSMPNRSASPSLQIARSYSPVSITLPAAFRFSGIGSGFTPPNDGFTSPRTVSTTDCSRGSIVRRKIRAFPT